MKFGALSISRRINPRFISRCWPILCAGTIAAPHRKCGHLLRRCSLRHGWIPLRGAMQGVNRRHWFRTPTQNGAPFLKWCTTERRTDENILAVSFLLCGVSSRRTAKDRPHWPMFRKHLIDAGANESATVADVNQDGRLDIIAGENWFEAPDWKKHHMREIPFVEGFIDDLSNFAMDVNDDGYPDVIASGWFGKKLAWYENPRRHDGDHANDLWKEHIIETGFNYELLLMVYVRCDG